MKLRRFVASYSEGSHDNDKCKDYRVLRFTNAYKFCRGAENCGAPRSPNIDSSNIDRAHSADGNPNHASANRLN